jgi:hypothetical protein
MPVEQSWKTCCFAANEIQSDPNYPLIIEHNPKLRLLLAIFKDQDKEDLADVYRATGISTWYYCKHPSIIQLGCYFQDGLPNIEGMYTPVALLFDLPTKSIQPDRQILDPRDEEDAGWIELKLSGGLAMCRHCRYYSPRGN